MIPGVRERMIATNGVQLRTLEAGPPGGPLVVLAHGFPELAFSWRHQIGVLAAAGYHVLAPDQRGYGGSSRPAEVDAYAKALASFRQPDGTIRASAWFRCLLARR